MKDDAERVTCHVEGGVAQVRLNRPEKRNGLDMAMFDALIATGERIIDDRSVRAVVLAGEGPMFCAGLDWKAFMGLGKDGLTLFEGRGDASANGSPVRAEELRRSTPANRAQRVCWIWQEVPVPVIAAVHGAAFGGGLQIALGADIRLVAPDTEMSFMEIRYGLVPDMGITKTLLKTVRLDVAKELCFTGRRVDAEEAVAIGLATRMVDDPIAEATELAELIAAQSPEAIRGDKRLLNEATELDVRAAFELETELQQAVLGSANQMEAVQAALMKQQATFRDPE